MEILTFQQGRSYIVKDREGYIFQIKVLALTDTKIFIEWSSLIEKGYDLQKFRFEYSIVEEVD